MKYEVLEEFVLGSRLVHPGEIVEGCTARMVGLGLVKPVSGDTAPKEELLTEVSSNVSVEINEDDPDIVKDVKSRIMEDGVVDEKEQRVLNKIKR